MKIVTKSIGNPHTGMREFHTRTRMSWGIHFSDFNSVDGAEFGHRGPTEIGQKIMEAILRLPGIEKVTLNDYQISTHLADAFDYDDDKIIKAVVNIIALEAGYESFKFERDDAAWTYGSVRFRGDHEVQDCPDGILV